MYTFVLLFCIFSSPARPADFTVIPLENTPDIAVYEVTGDYDAENPDGTGNVFSRQEITKEFYRIHPDEYDFLVIFSNFDFQMPQEEAIAFYQEIKNDVQGIGKELFDNSSLYGSNGMLQGTIDMGNINFIVSDPLDPGFSDTMATLSHELLHRWAASVTFRKADNTSSRDLLGLGGYHWSFLLDTAGSLEYGNHWVDNDNGTFTSLAGRRYFSPLDMYLMGFVDKSEVPPMLLIDNPDINPARLPEPGVTIQGNPQYITIDDIIAAEGDRVPDAADSRKNFKVGCIFITRPGTYSNADLYGIRNIMKSWSMWFSGLTNGRGKIFIANDPLHELPQNPGPESPPADPKNTPAEVNEGVAWLVNNQKPDGSWQDSLFTSGRDTTTVLHTLADFSTVAEASAKGLSWLENTDTANLDYLARKVGLLSSSGLDATESAAELLQLQNPDGGWGSGRNYSSNPADTALALRALWTAGEASASVAGSAIEYLLREQNGDSGWGTEGSSDIRTTMDVIISFIPFTRQYQLDTPVQNALAWVLTKQNGDGGFGSSPSTIYTTAQALIALKQIGISSHAADQALAYILERQERNGSWQSSAYQTALAVRAIWTATRDPDLSVSTAEIIPSPDTVTLLPTEVRLSVTVRNTGISDVADAKVVLYEGAVEDSSRIGEASVSVLGQSAETIVFNTTITRGTPSHYFVVVDPDNLIKETSKLNNSALRIVYPEATYDFAVPVENLSIVPAAGTVFEPLSISFKVKNGGTVDAFNVPIHLVADDGNGPVIVATQNVNLPAGKSVDTHIAWVPGISGAGILLSVVADPYDAFVEVAEDNNAATVTIDINGSTKPDLLLSYADISFDPAPALEAGNALLKARVFNRGFSSATDVQVDFHHGVPGENGSGFLGSIMIPDIKPGESVDAVFSWTDISVSGEKVISVVADPQNGIDEINEDNNSAFATLQVLALPDFAVYDSAISFSPEAPHEGDPVTVAAIIGNEGEQPGANIPVAFYQGSSLLGTAMIPEIAANGQATASLTFDTDGKLGVIRVEVVVDPDKTFLEQDTGNNRAEQSVGIQNADLWLSHSFISPNGDGIKDNTAFGYRLSAPRNVTVVVVDEEGQVVREYSGPDFIETTFVSLTWDGLDNKGRIVDDGQYRIQILSQTGTVLASLLVTVDTNRSSLLEALGTPYLYTTKIEYLLGDNKYNWLPDDSGVIFHLQTKKPEQPEYNTGIYAVSPMGGGITRLVPEEWSEDADPEIGYRYLLNSTDCNSDVNQNRECDQINPGFALSADGYTVAFILEKYDKATEEVLQQQLWSVNRYGEDFVLLDSFNYPAGDSHRITDIFLSPDGIHIAYKLYEQNTDHHFFAIIRSDGAGKTTFTPQWNNGFDNRHRLIWAPDGLKLVFSDAAHAVVADLSGNMREILPIENPTVFFDWYGANKILVRDLNVSNWLMDSWVVDLNAPESPHLIAEKIESPYSWYDFGGCIKKYYASGSVSKTPLLDNGHFIAGFEWKEYPYVNYIVCDMEGSCQDISLTQLWWPSQSLTPDAGKFVLNSSDGITITYDREIADTQFFKFGLYGCDNYLEERYSLPSHYKIWPPTESDCADGSYLIVPKWNWFDSNNFLAHYYGYNDGQHNNKVIVFNIENRGRTSFLEHASAYRLALSPGKRFISFLSGYNNSTKKYSEFEIAGSLLNLTADLRPGKTESAVNLQGIAADLNFAHWQLEYADQKAPGEWRIITPPVENPVVNGLLATWVPPYEGSFLVRLIVTDKAGNTVWDRKVVTWGRKFSVTSIYKTGELFSPNGDGIKDTVGLNYFVHEPVHLELSVHDQAGKVIRTYYQDHALPGGYGIVWDGRDQAGGIVPDGHYTIRIFDYEFFFQVDTTPPDARLKFSPVFCGDNPAVRSDLSGLGLDANLKGWTVYYGDGASPEQWHGFKSGETILAGENEEGGVAVDESGNPALRFIQGFATNTSPLISFLGNKTFRIVVEDLAGNQSIVDARFNEELLILSGWDGNSVPLEKNEALGVCESPDLLPISFLERGSHTLSIIETVGKAMISATVQYRMHMLWRDAGELVHPPEGDIDVTFDTSSLIPEEIAAVRVKAVDDAGLEYYSNSVVFNPPVFSASMGCIPEGSMSPALISMQVSLPESLETLQFQAANTAAGAVEWLHYLEYDVFDGFPYQFAAPYPGSLPEGYGYPLRFVGIGKSGREYISNALTEPPRQCPPPGEKPPSVPEKMCDPTTLTVFYSREKAPCNSVNSGMATIAVRYCPDDEPKTLPDKVKYYRKENGAWRFLKEFAPAAEGWGSVLIDTSGLTEGEHPVKVDLVYGDSVVKDFRSNTLIVDRTLPEARIIYPSLSAPFCARTTVNEKGDILRYADIEGVAADANDILGYSIVYGQGANPDQWLNVYKGIPCSPEKGDCAYLGEEQKTGQLGSWNVSDLEPAEHSLQLMVTDRFGNTSCFVTQADIDRSMLLAAEIDASIISPNGDGIMDEASVAYQAGEYAVLDITIKDDEDTVVRTLVAAQEIANSAGSVSWDGRADGGMTVADGRYRVLLTARDSCGNEQEKKFPVTVDNTPPTTMILFPGTGEPLDIITEVVGTVTDIHLVGYQLLARNEADGEEQILLKEGDIVIENDILGAWNTFGLEGNWALILTGEDRAGNTRTTTLPVSFGIRPQLVSGLKAAPKIFSPGSDGKFDTTDITYELTDTANITVAVKDILGNPVVSESAPNVLSGSHQYRWAGLDANGNRVADGKYKLSVTAESVTPPFVVQVENITVVTDTAAPAIDITAPQDFSYHAEAVAVQGALSDLNLREYSVVLTGGQEATLIDTASGSSEIVFSRSLELPEGVYQLQVDAMDSVDNTSSRTVSFIVDKTRPRIALESPGEGEFFGGSLSEVSIRGAIVETNLLSYSVQYGPGTNPAQWIDLASGEAPPPENVLATWAVEPEQAVADGYYTIRVTAVDKAGWQSVARVVIHVDNNPPEVAVAVPEEGEFVTELFDVIGTVDDPFLKEYTLKIADSTCAAAVNWSMLRTGTQPIENTGITSLQALPADGDHCIRLSAIDFMDNVSEQEVNFTIDTTPPGHPALSGSLEAGAGILLQWQGNSEPDLAGYYLYRNNEKINSALMDGEQYLDQDLAEGEYIYTVRAVDLAGWESADSNQVAFTVDFTPPEAMINSPRDGFLVSNYTDITGRAYSADDFREYRVSYGIGEEPINWELLRKSPVPVSYGDLVRWDVITLDNGLYTIRLEAEDLNGNINEKIVTVTVDNTPPAAPLLLTATPDGAAVDLDWQANSEPDLAGYLVFRNGQLANVTGTVVGDLAPYLITELGYRNIDVPDGNQEYYLVAMDNAGNMSEQSNSIEVGIDTHAPHLHIVTPLDGLEFDKPIPVKADTEDTDIDTVRFQYQGSGETEWIDFGGILTQRPYVVDLDPWALGWDYGIFWLRAMATDLGGLTEEMPEKIEIDFTDLTPPAAPTGMAARVNGGFVTLSWQQNQEEDLAGYNVYLGADTLRRNVSLLADRMFTDSSDFAEGEYEFYITAVDASGNESAKAPVTATVFTPVLNQPEALVSAAEIKVGGNTVPGATVEIFRNLIAESESLGTTLADGSGLFAHLIALTEGDNQLYAVAADPDGNISRPSNTVLVAYGIPPVAPTGLAAEVDNNNVSLSWNPNPEIDLAGYNIYRRTSETDWRKINITPVAASSYIDAGLKNGAYVYRVTAVNSADIESSPSNESSAMIEQQLPAPPSNLVAAAVPEGGAINLCWNASIDQVDGYPIYRSMVQGGPYARVNDSPATDFCYRDFGLSNGIEYFYVVRAVDSFGNESIDSNEDSAVPRDTIGPDKPLILLPTVSGRPYQSPASQVAVTGFAETGAAVDLIRNQSWIDTVETIRKPVQETFFLTDFNVYETVATRDGQSVYYSLTENTRYPYEYYTYRKDLATGLETRVDGMPEGSWNHMMSPDGTRMAFLYENEEGGVRIGVYDLSTGMTNQLNTEVDADEWDPAWSRDSTKIIFYSNSADSSSNLWIYDLFSGDTSLIARDFAGFYPEISPDNQKISYFVWDSVNRQLYLYTMDAGGGTPALVDDNVDWSGYYPSAEWSPQANKLVFSAYRDNSHDIYVLDADTWETSRLTDTESAEIYPQWSPDGKQVAYYVKAGRETEVRMVSADGQGEETMLHSFAGSVASDFIWLPSGIFYRVDSDLHRIIPPGTFIFEDVGLYPGQNVFTARAEDAAGNIGETADEILVSVDAASMPDLEVEEQDLYVLPNIPPAGEEATVVAVVRNISAVPAENVHAEIYIWNAEDNIELVHSQTIPRLDPHSEEWLSAYWDSTGMAGTNTLFVLLDPANEIAESREDNNFASRSFYVAEEEGVGFETMLNGREFSSQEVLSIEVALHNSGLEKDVRLTVLIEDENGTLVEELAVLDRKLPYGSSENVELHWKAGSVFAGTYQVRTVLVDGDAGLIGETLKPFTVLPDIDVAAALTANKVEYGPDENVLLGLSVTNRGANVILPQLRIKLTVSAAAGVHHVEEHELVNLSPLDSATLKAAWNTAQNVPGSYSASVEIFLDDELVASTGLEFAIVPVMGISGDVSVDPRVIFQGGGVRAGFSVAGSGNVAAGPTQIRILIVDTENRLTVSSYEESITLDLNEKVSGQHDFIGLNLDVGVYQVLLQSDHQGVSESLATDFFTVRDGIAPAVSILSPVDGSILHDSFDLAVTAVDDGVGVERVEYRKDDGSWLPMPLINPATGKYGVRWLPVEADEGAHKVGFRAADHAGNVSRTVESAIVIQPRVDMTTATDSSSYAMDEDVAIQVELVNTAWQKQVHLAAQVETQDGALVARLVDEDLVLGPDAGQTLNPVWNTGAVDAGKYRVRATLTKNGMVLAENFAEFVVKKVFSLTGTLTLSDTSVPPGEPVTGDWTVSNNGNFDLTSLIVENVLNDQVPAQLRTWTETVDLVKGQTLSGSFLLDTQGMATGSYLVTLKTRYEAESFDLAAAQFELVDTIPPVVKILSPPDGTLVNGPVEVAASATDDASGVEGLEYRIDQRDWQPLPVADPAAGVYKALWSTTEEDEGARTISFRGRDKAGNISEPVSVGVTVELCRAFEDLTGSLSVTPDLIYYGQDVVLEYRLTNQCSKAISDLDVGIIIIDPVTGNVMYEETVHHNLGPDSTFAGSFSVSSLMLHIQEYTVRLEASRADKPVRVLAESSFEILPALDVDNAPLDQANLLVWLNNGRCECRNDEEEDHGEHDEDDEHDGCDGQKEHDDDENEWCHQSRICGEDCGSFRQIVSIVDQVADYYLVVCDRDEFEQELRNPVYSDIMIIGDKHQLTGHHDEELREKIYSGSGLISFGWSVPGDHLADDEHGHKEHNESFLGVKRKGLLSKIVPPVNLEDSAITEAGILNLSNRLQKVESAADTIVAGWVSVAYKDHCGGEDDDEEDKKHGSSKDSRNDHGHQARQYPVLVLHEYGLGKTVFAGFDLCEAFDDWNKSQLADLLIHSLGYVHRSDGSAELVPHLIRAFGLEVASPGQDFDLTVKGTCPAEIMLYDQAYENWVKEYPWISTYQVNVGETATLPYYVLAPDEEGTFTCEFKTGVDDGSQYILFDTLLYEFEVLKDRARRLQDAIAAVDALVITRKEYLEKNNILKYLQKIRKRAVTDGADTEKNIHDMEKAINALLEIESVDITGIRLQLDTLLRIEQGRNYLFE
ncbi:MAG: Ig-like domain-containing protein [Desulfobulbaceae bacterium]|nr:Ig-like domain-containing protein [Desulfobulbaceae bacterium]